VADHYLTRENDVNRLPVFAFVKDDFTGQRSSLMNERADGLQLAWGKL
jgi:hypothetical protein